MGSCAALAFSDNDRDPFVAVLAKRTYRFDTGGHAEPAPEQEGLCGRVLHALAGQGGRRPLRHDDDRLCMAKQGTDLVVQGSAYSRRGPVREMSVSVRVEDGEASRKVELLVVGDRRLDSRGGRIAFSGPASFTEMSVSYDRAYGGHDVWSERERPDETLDRMAAYLPVERIELHRYLYPRNPAGCGYVIHGDAACLEQVTLPNVERPDRRLTPERLIVGSPHRWHRALVPAGFDWRDQFWFPRCALLGFMPRCELADGETIHEVATGELPSELVPGDLRHVLHQRFVHHFAHGASEGLVFDTWNGRERVTVRGMHPSADEVSVAIPSERPHIVVDLPRGGATELTPALRTVVIRPAEGSMVLSWCARQSYRGLISDELATTVPFGVEWR